MESFWLNETTSVLGFGFSGLGLGLGLVMVTATPDSRLIEMRTY